MDKQTQLNLFQEFTKRQLNVIESKQQDYADTSICVLDNFKSAAANAGITTNQQLLALIATKVARLGNLFKGKEPNHESIDDSVLDMANYCFLLYCAIIELKPKEEIVRPSKGWKVHGPQENGY